MVKKAQWCAKPPLALLDAARQGDDVAQMFAQESGIMEAAYTGAMEYTHEILKYELAPNGQYVDKY